MKPKFTPGPWRIETFRNETGIYTHSIVAEGKRIHREGTYDSVPSGDCHLIASAPELLEACKQALAAMPDETFATEFPGQRDTIRFIKAAIAKAEGGEK